jgi:hypothetical protein
MMIIKSIALGLGIFVIGTVAYVVFKVKRFRPRPRPLPVHTVPPESRSVPS